MPLPQNFYDEGVNYRIRVCLTIAHDPLIGMLTGSKVHQCDRCGEPVWVDESQSIPPLPDFEIHGDVSLCMPCAQFVMQEAGDDGDGVEWIDGHGPADKF